MEGLVNEEKKWYNEIHKSEKSGKSDIIIGEPEKLLIREQYQFWFARKWGDCIIVRVQNIAVLAFCLFVLSGCGASQDMEGTLPDVEVQEANVDEDTAADEDVAIGEAAA